MFEQKVVSLILAIIMCLMARAFFFGHNCGLRTLFSVTFDVIAFGLVGYFDFLVASQGVGLFTIPRLMAFTAVCVYIRFKEEDKICYPFWVLLGITIALYTISGGWYIGESFIKTYNLKTILGMVQTITTVGLIALAELGILLGTKCMFESIFAKARFPKINML